MWDSNNIVTIFSQTFVTHQPYLWAMLYTPAEKVHNTFDWDYHVMWVHSILHLAACSRLVLPKVPFFKKKKWWFLLTVKFVYEIRQFLSTCIKTLKHNYITVTFGNCIYKSVPLPLGIVHIYNKKKFLHNSFNGMWKRCVATANQKWEENLTVKLL